MIKKPNAYLKESNFKNPVLWTYVLIALIATLQCILGHLKSFAGTEKIYTQYNNYIIFKNSFFHLIQGKDLYRLYLTEQWDLYKYSPSFSFLFGTLAYLPDAVGLLIWNLLNIMPVIFGIKLLKGISNQNKSYILLFCVIEMLGSLQNAQSNGLMAGLILMTFVSLENGKYFLATLFVFLSVYIKIYGGIAFVLFIFYPEKQKLALYTLFWFILIGLLPLFVISPDQLLFLFRSWGELLKDDQAQSVGLSVSGILSTWFHWQISKNIITLVGIILFLLPLLRVKNYSSGLFRLTMLCSALVWVVIFNHKSESPTFIIAELGIAIWYFSQEQDKINTTLVTLTFILTTLSVTDLIPGVIRNNFVNPYCIKAIMPIIVWCKIILELLFGKFYRLVEKKLA
jgi:hypothetical protein